MSNVETSGAISYYDPEQIAMRNRATRLDTADNPFGETRMALFNTGNLNNNSIGTQGAFRPKTIQQQLEELYAGSGSGSGSGSGATQLGYAELAYKKAKDAQDRQDALAALGYDRAQSARILGGMENYYTSGQYGKGFDDLLNMINEQGKVSETGVRDAYGRAMTNIGQGYDVASGLGTAGFNALNQYLAQNQNNPYAGMQATAGTAPDALTSYLSAYGVSDQPVQGQIQADQLQAQQGAANYQNLIDVLSGIAQQGAGSRGAESQMAQLLFNTGLGQERAGYQGQAENAQAQALAALQQQLFQSRFGVQSDRNSLANQLAMQIVGAGGNLSGSGSGSGGGGGGGDDMSPAGPLPGQLPQTATPQEIVANQLANLLAPAQAQNSTAEQLLAELNARRGR